MAHDVFVSYSNKDKAIADSIVLLGNKRYPLLVRTARHKTQR